ncbi:hypothetical protein C8046_00155 [Serinibacter arcticus]|uniref:Uncharacterized protein n=1 Tax=Serinibacter arcticus TaxID=1655435 RepID=A0A2U1ZR02_9MICO|nr:hypothetical protein [Serinibacter arcticus]PWD49371.1 hypothetical protein C8046_00155 [Serinibacter arcticus]
MASLFWGRTRKNQQQDELDSQDAVLAQRAGRALVEADERLRLTTDELGFAVAELGEAATADLRDAVESVRTHLGEAFRLHQLNTDHIPDTPEELRERNARIVQLADWAQDLLDARTADLERAVSKVREAPAVVENVRSEATRIRGQVPHAHETVTRLGERYSSGAVRQVADNAAEAEQLISFAEHSLDVAARRRDSGNNAAATVALEAATEGIRRSATLLEAVETFEIEALRAESTLAAVVADSRGDLIAVRDVPATPDVTRAAAELEAALAALPAAGTPSDPFGNLSRLREANTALDRAVDVARERAARPVPGRDQLAHAIDDAERQLAVARDVIAGHRGYIGADARTRLAEAERTLTDVHRCGSDDDSREQAFGLARRSATLAAQALDLARQDIDGGRDQGWGDDGWDDGRGDRDRRGGYGRGAAGLGGLGALGGLAGGRGRGRGGDLGGLGGLAGGLLGGMVLGEVFDDLFD